jgi:minor extracellular protease Epr
MLRRPLLITTLVLSLLLAGGAAGAQLLPGAPQLPDLGGTLDRIGRSVDGAVNQAGEALDLSAGQLAELRLTRLRDLVRANPDRLEMTDAGPAVRGQVIAINPSPVSIARAVENGFVVAGQERIDGLGFETVTLDVPRGWSVDRALNRLRRLAPDGQFAANHIHSPAGSAALTGTSAVALAQSDTNRVAIGLIDGGVAQHPVLRGQIEQRGFARGAPRASAHGTAVASLAVGSGSVRGAAPGAPLLVADIYGSDPAGGNAVALARALGFMVQRRTPVVAVSLVGPSNPLVARAIAQAQAQGIFIVAAVGNDGPAAPPAYPASYPGVLSITAVDGRNRVLIEAGRASHIDYAAPGSDMAAARAGGQVALVRGTSYAVPLVAGRLYRHAGSPQALARLDQEATERGRRGFGRGLICAECRTPPPRR